MGITRREFAVATALVAAAGGLEYLSLTGRFDHRRRPQSSTETSAGRFFAALKELDAKPAAADGAVVHVGHSTHLLSIAGARLLTDPWFNDPAFGALSHIAGPAAPAEAMGSLDAILVSHEHADHLDPTAADRLDKRAKVIVGTSYVGAVMRGLGFRDAVVLEPWESLEVKGARVTAVPGLHDVHEIGFVVQGAGRSVYFAGDTRLHPDLPAIAERFAPTLAILPVDGTRYSGGGLHVMTPDDAVEAARILKTAAVMPSHADAQFSDPLVAHALATTIAGAPGFFAAAIQRALPRVRCHLPLPGELVPLARVA